MQAYHDTEWGVPQRDPRALWEMLMLEAFQAGLSWITPIGPLTFAIAKPLNTKDDDDTQVFQFSLGQGF